MSISLRPSALALVLLAAFAQAGTAGMVGFTVAPTVPAPNGSIDTKSDGSIVGTNLNVTVVFGTATPGSTPIQYSINAYLDFSTGSLLGTDAGGNKTYSSANANFFILGGLLTDPTHGAGSPPLAYSVDMLTTVTPVTGGFALSASLLGAYLDPTIAQSFGMPGGSIFTGTFVIDFAFDSSKAGDQVSGGGDRPRPECPVDQPGPGPAERRARGPRIRRHRGRSGRIEAPASQARGLSPGSSKSTNKPPGSPSSRVEPGGFIFVPASQSCSAQASASPVARCIRRSISARQRSTSSRSASGGTRSGRGITHAAGENGRGTANRSQLLARQQSLNAIPTPTTGRPVLLDK